MNEAPTRPRRPPGLPTRRAARDVLDAVLEAHRPLEEALEAANSLSRIGDVDVDRSDEADLA